MPVKRTSTTNSTPPKVGPKAKDDEVFDFIVERSKETLSFPLSSEISEKFGFSGTYVFNVLERLVAQGLIVKIGRYHFRIAAPDHV